MPSQQKHPASPGQYPQLATVEVVVLEVAAEDVVVVVAAEVVVVVAADVVVVVATVEVVVVVVGGQPPLLHPRVDSAPVQVST